MAITLALLAYLHLPVVRRFILTVKDCEPFEDGFENGKMEVTGVTLGSLAVFECNAPYELAGRTQRQCINGEWTGQQPTCIRELVHQLCINRVNIMQLIYA